MNLPLRLEGRARRTVIGQLAIFVSSIFASLPRGGAEDAAIPAKNTGMTIRRGFADIGTNFAKGLQVHYRTAGSGGPRPVIVLHPSPGSTKMMKPLIQAYAETRQAIGLDTLGNGDSSTPAVGEPDISYFARAHMCGLVAHFLAMRSALQLQGQIGCTAM